MRKSDAMKEAALILKDEANELAVMSNQQEWKQLPHRAKVAISKEITRLRDIAYILYPEGGR